MFILEQSWLMSLVLPILAVSISMIILVYAYLKLRPRFPIRVTCWFCHKKTDVPYDNRNCWDCPHCEQYNGFCADGSYNKVIPSQHDELLNHCVTAKSSFTKKSPPTSSKSPFCRKCTINQDLKIHQLASFTPRNPACFEEEVEEYRLHLERAYQLCDSCEQVVKRTLHQQQGWLLDQYRKHLLSLRSESTQRVFAWWQRGLPVVWLQWVQVASAVTAFGLLISQSHALLTDSFSHYISPDIAYLLEIAPNYEHIVATIMTCVIIVITGCSTFKMRVDIITSVLWFVMLVHKWLLLWPYMKSQISEEDLKTGHVVVVSLTFLVNMVAVFTTHQVCPSKKLMVKKLNQNDICQGRNIAEYYSSPSGPDTAEHSSNKFSSQCSSETSFSCSSPVPSIVDCVESDKYSAVQSPVSGKTTPVHASVPPCGELEWGIGKLSLGPSDVRNRNCSIFKAKSYGSVDTINAFRPACHNTTDSEHQNRRSPLLRPSKLNIPRKVTQTSWVAGGYWRELGGTFSKAVQSGRNFLETSLQTQSFSPASRSSSQSSGFHSRSSNSPVSSPNSYSGSLCGGETDRFSVLSEPVAPLVACPCGSVTNEHNLQSVSKVPFMGMPYYGSFPMYIPNVYPLSVTTPSVFNGRNVPWMVNPQYFGTSKQYFPSSCYFPHYPHTIKQFPHAPVLPSDALSHSGSSIRSKDILNVSEQTNSNVQNMWHFMKQNFVLSVLCIGSILCNIVGMVVLVYKNRFVFQV